MKAIENNAEKFDNECADNTFHVFNLENELTKNEKKLIIKNKTDKYVSKLGMRRIDAYRRAQKEILPSKKYKKYAEIAIAICYYFCIETTSRYIKMSTNRDGKHSWYIDIDGYIIRISDHITAKARNVDICLYPMRQSYREMLSEALMGGTIHSLKMKIETLKEKGYKEDQSEKIKSLEQKNSDLMWDLSDAVKRIKDLNNKLIKSQDYD